MESLYQRLVERVGRWRNDDYPSEAFPAISEILNWSRVEETGELRFLRKPQFRALETYWYLRLVENTPRVFDLYKGSFPQTNELLKALGLDHSDIKDVVVNDGPEALWERIRTDDDFVRTFRLQALRETLTLDYPSYILALAMGAGKTILIGAIIATEFAMAMEYPDAGFVQNALVFAPGKTIIESLRELTIVPYDRILPMRFFKGFAASVKLTFTRDGDPDLSGVIERSLFNVVVTNTEKIRIQKEQIRKSDIGSLLSGLKADEARQELANRRLQTIASLPHLAIFSDEAHHTYGQALDTELKKVRKTVDYLAAQTSVVCVVNTTGTPYYQRQPLKDVVVWYGLSEGIRDRILKEVGDNIQSFEFDDRPDAYVSHVVADFFERYKDVALPDGAPAKLAMYFPQTDDLRDLRPAVDAALAAAGLGPDLVLVNTSDETLTKTADIDAFNRLNDPRAPHRVILLVNKGTEGWNCPSLFACALARKLRTSNNFVLQAATRCLRQVPGNDVPARIYLSQDNFAVLDRQLKETYGEGIEELQRQGADSRRERLVLRKRKVPPLVLKREITRVIRREPAEALRLTLPSVTMDAVMTVSSYAMAAEHSTSRLLQQVGDTLQLTEAPRTIDTFAAAASLATDYRLDALGLREQLYALYPGGELPEAHLPALERQVEEQLSRYDAVKEQVEIALALVKEDGFTKERDERGRDVYVTEIVYPKSREKLLVREDSIRSRWEFGYHYAPYDFDSNPERVFFEKVLKAIDLHPADVEDIYFTGGITDPAKTDFFVEYKDAKGKWRRYTPDFLIRKRPPHGRPAGSGRVYIVEVKAEKEREDPVSGVDGSKARQVREWERVNPEGLKYEMIFTSTESIDAAKLKNVLKFTEAPESYLPISLDRGRLAEFCRKWKIDRMWVFGSVLTEKFGPESDIDFLVRYEPNERWSLFELMDAEEELKGIVGRNVDLVDRRSVEQSKNWIRRRSILESAVPFHVA
jgi:type III restriction enzyme